MSPYDAYPQGHFGILERGAPALDLLNSVAVDHALSSLCAIVCRITSAPIVIIAQRNPLTSTIQVRGRIGTLVEEVDMTFALPALDSKRQPILVVPDIRSDPRFSGHPLLRIMPHLKSLIAMLVPGQDPAYRAVLKIVNPSKASVSDGAVHQMLAEICVTAGDILNMERAAAPLMRDETQPGFLQPVRQSAGFTAGGLHEEAESFAMSDIRASFLMETLVKRRMLHSRNNTDYITLRKWRTSLKKYQIASLTSLKTAPPPQFVASVAEEIVASVRKSFGDTGIQSVVPVPPGSSGQKTSLSILLAHAVADRLNAHVHHALASTGAPELGKSTPRKSARLPPYRLGEPVPGPILVVDDVASSGRHLELAIEACRASSPTVHAIAWIGG